MFLYHILTNKQKQFTWTFTVMCLNMNIFLNAIYIHPGIAGRESVRNTEPISYPDQNQP